MAISHVKSNPVANMTGTVTVFNSAGVTTTAAATDLVRPVDWNSAHNQFMTIGGNTAGVSTLSGTNIEFHGAGAVSLSGNGQTVVFSAPAQSVQTQGSVQVQGSTGAISFANGNGITFGGNASTITASHNGLTSQSNQAYSAGNGSVAFQTLTFADSNGVSFSTGTQGLFATVRTNYAASDHSHGNPTLALTNLSGTTASNSAGLTLSLSAAAPGAGGGIAAAAGTQTATSGTVAFANSNGVTFGMSGSSQITASYTVPSATVTVNAVSNTTQNSSGTVNLSGLSFQGAGVASVGLSNGSVVISVPSGGGAGDGGNVIAAGTQTGTSLGTVKFENSNGITFGMSGSTQVTASHNGLTTAAQSDHSHGNPTLALTNLNGTTASASNGLTLSLSAAAQSVQPVAVSGQNGSYAFSTLSFSNANGISFGSSGASAITASHNGLTSQSNQALSGSNGSFTFQTATFGNLNGVSFYTSNGSLVASHNGLTTAAASDHSHGNPTLALTNLSGTTASNSAGLTLSLSAAAGGGVNPAASASNGSFAFTTLNFSNANNVTFGTSAGGIITASVAAPGAAAEQNAINLLGANTAGNTTATGSTIGLSGLNLTLSGTNNSQVVISAPATSSLVGAGGISISTAGSTITLSYTGGGGAEATLSYFNPQDAYVQVAGQLGQGSLLMQPMQAPNVQFDRVMIPINFTGATNSSGSFTVSFWMGTYTRNDSTLSLASSQSTSYNVTMSGTAGSYSQYGGMRLLSMGTTGTLNAGQYWVGVVSRTTTAGAAGMTMSNMLASQINSSFSGIWGEASNATVQYTRGLGRYSATTSGMPAAVAFSELQGNSSAFLRQPLFYMVSGTV